MIFVKSAQKYDLRNKELLFRHYFLKYKRISQNKTDNMKINKKSKYSEFFSEYQRNEQIGVLYEEISKASSV
jgi:hypothetical protein